VAAPVGDHRRELNSGELTECGLALSIRRFEGPIRRTREGGSKWEPIKILLEGDGNSNKMNTGQTSEHHPSERSLLVKVGNFH
jgi:hypothetical protein